MAGNTSIRPRTYPVKAYLYLRFSSKKQRDGNSTARQTDMAVAWCQRKKIDLDDTLAVADEGVSAFRGKNKTSGGLNLFMEACRAGRVKKGSYLIVENLDRLSREHPLDGMELVRKLIRDYGIVLVTLRPELEFSAGNLDMVNGILMYVELARGHSESASKSARSADNWARKRAKLGEGVILTEKVPGWCKVENGKIVAVPEKVELVKMVFDLARKGFGYSAITKRLNEKKIPTIGRSKIWHESYVVRMLTSRAAIGEYQPRKIEGGQLVPVGDVVKNYYPAVINQDVFHAVRSAVIARRNQRGRVTKKVGNLFTGVVFLDGQPLAYRSKNFTGYLQPGTLDHPGILYRHFERVMLTWLREVRLHLDQSTEYVALKDRTDQLEKSIAELEKQIKNNPSLVSMLPTLAEWKKDQADCLQRLETAALPLNPQFLHGQRLVETLAAAGPDERELLRRELRQVIRQTVGRIDVTVDGKPKREKLVTATITMADGQRRQLQYMTRAGRIISAGLTLDVVNLPTVKILTDEMEAEGFRGTPDQWNEEVAHRAFRSILDPNPKADIIARCKALRKAGVPYKQIMAETGLRRETIYRYVTDYQRKPGRQKVGPTKPLTRMEKLEQLFKSPPPPDDPTPEDELEFQRLIQSKMDK